MPIYEYVCSDCETRFERLLPSNRMDDPAPCPRGHKSARRVLSTFSALTQSANGSEEPAGGGGCGGGCANCACSAN